MDVFKENQVLAAVPCAQALPGKAEMPVYLAALAAVHEWYAQRRRSPPVCHQGCPDDGLLVMAEDPQLICSCRAKLGLCRRLYQPPQGPPAPQRPLVAFVQPRMQSEHAVKTQIWRLKGELDTKMAL